MPATPVGHHFRPLPPLLPVPLARSLRSCSLSRCGSAGDGLAEAGDGEDEDDGVLLESSVGESLGVESALSSDVGSELGSAEPDGVAEGSSLGVADGSVLELADGSSLGVADGSVLGLADGSCEFCGGGTSHSPAAAVASSSAARALPSSPASVAFCARAR